MKNTAVLDLYPHTVSAIETRLVVLVKNLRRIEIDDKASPMSDGGGLQISRCQGPREGKRRACICFFFAVAIAASALLDQLCKRTRLFFGDDRLTASILKVPDAYCNVVGVSTVDSVVVTC